MRTTLSIDDDVLRAAKALAALEQKTVGEVISELARTALRPASTGMRTRNGIPLLPVHAAGTPVTSELVRQLLEEIH